MIAYHLTSHLTSFHPNCTGFALVDFCSFPASFLALVDTYDTLRSGVPNFLAVALALCGLGYAPIGIRLDSGDLTALSIEAQRQFSVYAQRYSPTLPTAPDMAKNLIIMASNSLNEHKLLELKNAHHAVRAFGIGTELVTCRTQPALGCVYKLAELDRRARMKLSEDAPKMTIPGSKRAYRIFITDSSGSSQLVVDLMSTSSEEAPCQGEALTYFELSQFRDARTHEGEASTRTIVPARVEPLLQEKWQGSAGAGRQSSLYGTTEYLTNSRQRCKNEMQALGHSTGKPCAHVTGMSLALGKLVRSVMASFHDSEL
jgi:nicotinate phosphoribosyltransferase